MRSAPEVVITFCHVIGAARSLSSADVGLSPAPGPIPIGFLDQHRDDPLASEQAQERLDGARDGRGEAMIVEGRWDRLFSAYRRSLAGAVAASWIGA
jgi:hypothetical protein